MRQLKLFGVTLAALLVLGVATAVAAQAAFTLPDISLLPDEEYPLHLNYDDPNFIVVLSDPVLDLDATGLYLLILCQSLSSLCTYDIDLENVKNGDVPCNTPGDPEGEVLIGEHEEEVHFVSFLEAGILRLGLLFLLAKVLPIECGTVKIKVKGSALSKLHPNGGEADQTKIGALLTGNGLGKPTYSTYYNDNKEEVRAKLESNFGTGYKESALEGDGEIILEALDDKMFMITLW